MADAAGSADPCFQDLTDAQLLAETAKWEQAGRLVDARRIAAAAEIERRSAVGEEGLAHREGRRDACALLASIARISEREAKRRIGLGAPLAPRTSLTGEELPGRFPATAESLRAGEIGLEAARVVVETLQAVRRRASVEDLDAAEVALADAARETEPDLLRVHAAVWQARLDPDGAEPAEAEQRHRRAFRLGRTGADGMTAFSGHLHPEATLLAREVLHAHRRNVPMLRIAAGGEDDEALDPQWRETEGERWTRAQWDFDTWFATFSAGVRAEQDGSGTSLRTPHEVVVQVDAADAEQRRGAGRTEGAAARLSLPTVERIACSGRRPPACDRRGGRAAASRAQHTPVQRGAAQGARAPLRRPRMAGLHGAGGLVRRPSGGLVRARRRLHDTGSGTTP